jgi:aryl-alcohol dehydrogenase-like predicted oxidoreductase
MNLVNGKETVSQVALAWLLAQKPWIVPIPGTIKLHRLEENIGAAEVELTADDLAELAMSRRTTKLYDRTKDEITLSAAS